MIKWICQNHLSKPSCRHRKEQEWGTGRIWRNFQTWQKTIINRFKKSKWIYPLLNKNSHDLKPISPLKTQLQVMRSPCNYVNIFTIQFQEFNEKYCWIASIVYKKKIASIVSFFLFWANKPYLNLFFPSGFLLKQLQHDSWVKMEFKRLLKNSRL